MTKKGRFRDAEIASESIHSAVQLLSLYHDNLLARAVLRLPLPTARSRHARYTRFWSQRSSLYRRLAMVLQMVSYTELLCEMAAKRSGGEKARWRVVVLLEAIKAICRLLLLRITRSRPLVSPPLPEREPMQMEDDEDDGYGDDDIDDDQGPRSESELMDEVAPSSAAAMDDRRACKPPYEKSWEMPRTGLRLPPLPKRGNISSFLVGRVLTADDIRPATKLLNQLGGSSQVAELLHIAAPLIYAVAMARSRKQKEWWPWAVGLAVECAARQLHVQSLQTTRLEKDEWKRRGWAMGWWVMRGAFYDKVTKSLVGTLTRRMPSLIGGILEDYEYLWEEYHFSTST